MEAAQKSEITEQKTRPTEVFMIWIDSDPDCGCYFEQFNSLMDAIDAGNSNNKFPVEVFRAKIERVGFFKKETKAIRVKQPRGAT